MIKMCDRNKFDHKSSKKVKDSVEPIQVIFCDQIYLCIIIYTLE